MPQYLQALDIVVSANPLYVLTHYSQLPAALQYLVLQRIDGRGGVTVAHFHSLLDAGLQDLDFSSFSDGVVSNAILECATRYLK